MRKNPCELQIDLFCRGLRIEDSPDHARPLSRTRAGLGSGLELILAGEAPRWRDVWVNAPVTESFATCSPYLLRARGDAHEILDSRSGEVHSVRLPREPAWYRKKTSRGILMRDVGVLQGTYLAVYVGTSCAFWQGEDPQACAFCTTGCNVGEGPLAHTEPADVVETARAAKEESGVTFVHLNTGYQRGRALRMLAPFVRALKEEVGVLVGVQAVPEGPFEEFDTLRELGADHFSFCYEYQDPEWFRRLCPGKAEHVGQQRFFDALRYCQARMPRGACSGEIIAGNEPIESTLQAIDFITSLGAFPTVCIFRPLPGSAMEHWPPPEYEDMCTVMRHVWQACRDRRVPIGLAPNIDVSLIVQPADTAYLAAGGWRDTTYRWRLAFARMVAAPVFRRRMRALPAAERA